MTRVAVVNMAWQLTGNRELLTEACAGYDVVLVCEALADGGRAPLDLRKVVPAGWMVVQDTSTTARAGVAVLYHAATMTALSGGNRRSGTVRLSKRGFRVRDRYLTYVVLRDWRTGDRRPYAAFHAPLRRTGRKGQFFRALDGWLSMHPHAVAGGDTNTDARKLRRLVGRQGVGVEVMALLHPADLRPGVLLPRFSEHTDHPILRVALKQAKP